MRFDETNFNVRLHAYGDELFYIRTNYDYDVEVYYNYDYVFYFKAFYTKTFS